MERILRPSKEISRFWRNVRVKWTVWSLKCFLCAYSDQNWTNRVYDSIRAKVFTQSIHFLYCFFRLKKFFCHSCRNILVLFWYKYFKVLVCISLAFLQLIIWEHDKNFILQFENGRRAVVTSLLFHINFYRRIRF